jgi:preprotein translocase subunit SecG
MTTPNRPPNPNRPHASRGEKVRNAKGSFGAGAGAGGHGLGDAPNSKLKKFAMWFVVVMIVLFIVMDFVDRANAKKKTSFHYEPSSGLMLSKIV